MALLGKDLAVVSVGISCQTDFQITTHRGTIAKLAGLKPDALEERTTPFDAMYCPVKSAAEMIKHRRFYPTDVGELAGTKRPLWPAMGCHFWHEKFDDPEKFLSKQAHLVDNWDRIRSAKRRIFIVSNTQNNIVRSLIERDREPIECRLIWDDVFRLFGILARSFQAQIELHVVARLPAGVEQKTTTTALVTRWEDGRPSIQLHGLERDASQWAGDLGQWGALFKRIIP